MTKKLQELLKKISEKQQELEKARPFNKEKIQKLKDVFRVEYSYHSNHLEGNTLTMQETRALLTTEIVASSKNKKLRDYIEMKGHDKAVQYIGLIEKLCYTENIIKTEKSLSPKTIKELHAMIMIENHKKQVRDASGNIHFVDVIVGERKKKDNHIQRVSDGTMFYFASSFEVPGYIQDLLTRIDEKKEQYHPLVLAGLFHYKFIRIHPFDDGNGRTARLLMNMILMKYGYPILIVPSDKVSRNEYYNALELTDKQLPQLADVFDTNNMEKYSYFLEYLGERLLASYEMIEKV